jgi:hypothetical protein
MATQQLSTITSVYVGYPVYAYEPTPPSLGITSPGSARGLYSLANQGPFSIGINAASFAPTMVRALAGPVSIGVSSTGELNVIRAIQTPASLGITSAAKFGKLRWIPASGSLGVTSVGNPTHFFRLVAAFGSLGVTSRSVLNVRRFGSMRAGLGIDANVRPSVTPSSVAPLSIAIFEATDVDNPATIGGLIARNYQRLTLDQTVSSYPVPYTLLN